MIESIIYWSTRELRASLEGKVKGGSIVAFIIDSSGVNVKIPTDLEVNWVMNDDGSLSLIEMSPHY